MVAFLLACVDDDDDEKSGISIKSRHAVISYYEAHSVRLILVTSDVVVALPLRPFHFPIVVFLYQ